MALRDHCLVTRLTSQQRTAASAAAEAAHTSIGEWARQLVMTRLASLDQPGLHEQLLAVRLIVLNLLAHLGSPEGHLPLDSLRKLKDVAHHGAHSNAVASTQPSVDLHSFPLSVRLADHHHQAAVAAATRCNMTPSEWLRSAITSELTDPSDLHGDLRTLRTLLADVCEHLAGGTPLTPTVLQALVARSTRTPPTKDTPAKD